MTRKGPVILLFPDNNLWIKYEYTTCSCFLRLWFCNIYLSLCSFLLLPLLSHPTNTVSFRSWGRTDLLTLSSSAVWTPFEHVCETHFVKWLLHLIALADVILAPHNLAAFLCECAVMVPGQLTASWTRWAEAFCINFTLKMPYQSRNSTSKGNLKGYCFLLSAERLYPVLLQRLHHALTSTGTHRYGQIWFLLLGPFQIFPSVPQRMENNLEWSS